MLLDTQIMYSYVMNVVKQITWHYYYYYYLLLSVFITIVVCNILNIIIVTFFLWVYIL